MSLQGSFTVYASEGDHVSATVNNVSNRGDPVLGDLQVHIHYGSLVIYMHHHTAAQLLQKLSAAVNDPSLVGNPLPV